MTVLAAEEAGAVASRAKAAETATAAKGAKGAPPAGAGRAPRARKASAAASPAAETSTATPEQPKPPGWTPPAALTDMRGAPSWYQRAAQPDPVAAANAGGGFLLGLFAWALGLAYLRGGGPEVKRLLAAKFFNRTE